MKKDYNAPEMELIMLQLSRDVLGDSKQEEPINPGYDDPIDDLF